MIYARRRYGLSDAEPGEVKPDAPSRRQVALQGMIDDHQQKQKPQHTRTVCQLDAFPQAAGNLFSDFFTLSELLLGDAHYWPIVMPAQT
jgi:hypothetical protein